MDGRMIKKNLVFYSPGKPGVLFTFIANHYISYELLRQTTELLQYENDTSVEYVEERRTRPRLIEHEPLYDTMH